MVWINFVYVFDDIVNFVIMIFWIFEHVEGFEYDECGGDGFVFEFIINESVLEVFVGLILRVAGRQALLAVRSCYR